MLLTEQQLSRRRRLVFPQPERMKKVRKSMGAIKQVLGERKRAHLQYLHEQEVKEKAEAAEQAKRDAATNNDSMDVAV
jgi:predicted transcriptional regulator